MANVLNRTTGNSGSYPYVKDYRTSVNDPDYPTADWIHNPDLSAVAGFDSIYWIISGDSVTLANPGQRSSIDADIAAVLEQNQKSAQKNTYTDNEIFRAQIKYVVDEINILRAQHSLADRTYSEAQTYMFNAIDNGEV